MIIYYQSIHIQLYTFAIIHIHYHNLSYTYKIINTHIHTILYLTLHYITFRSIASHYQSSPSLSLHIYIHMYIYIYYKYINTYIYIYRETYRINCYRYTYDMYIVKLEVSNFQETTAWA